jgi:hypothetical protein
MERAVPGAFSSPAFPTPGTAPSCPPTSTLLLAAAGLHDKPVTSEVTRMQAVAMMQRNLARSLTMASIAALVELAVGPHRLLAACCAVLLSTAVVSTIRRERGRHDTTRG